MFTKNIPQTVSWLFTEIINTRDVVHNEYYNIDTFLSMNQIMVKKKKKKWFDLEQAITCIRYSLYSHWFMSSVSLHRSYMYLLWKFAKATIIYLLSYWLLIFVLNLLLQTSFLGILSFFYERKSKCHSCDPYGKFSPLKNRISFISVNCL